MGESAILLKLTWSNVKKRLNDLGEFKHNNDWIYTSRCQKRRGKKSEIVAATSPYFVKIEGADDQNCLKMLSKTYFHSNSPYTKSLLRR